MSAAMTAWVDHYSGCPELEAWARAAWEQQQREEQYHQGQQQHQAATPLLQQALGQQQQQQQQQHQQQQQQLDVPGSWQWKPAVFETRLTGVLEKRGSNAIEDDENARHNKRIRP